MTFSSFFSSLVFSTTFSAPHLFLEIDPQTISAKLRTRKLDKCKMAFLRNRTISGSFHRFRELSHFIPSNIELDLENPVGNFGRNYQTETATVKPTRNEGTMFRVWIPTQEIRIIGWRYEHASILISLDTIKQQTNTTTASFQATRCFCDAVLVLLLGVMLNRVRHFPACFREFSFFSTQLIFRGLQDLQTSAPLGAQDPS